MPRSHNLMVRESLLRSGHRSAYHESFDLWIILQIEWFCPEALRSHNMKWWFVNHCLDHCFKQFIVESLFWIISKILEIIPWTQNAYTLLYQPRHRVAFSSSIYALIWTNSAPLWPGWYRRVYPFCVQGIIPKMALRWRRGDVTVPNCWIKSLFLFYFRTKSILVAS